MPLSSSFIVAFISVAVVLLIGILIFSSVMENLDYEQYESDGKKLDSITKEQLLQVEEQTESNFWIILGIIPIALFISLFTIFGVLGGGGGLRDGLGGSDDDDDDDDSEHKPKFSVLRWLGLEFLLLTGLAKKEVNGT